MIYEKTFLLDSFASDLLEFLEEMFPLQYMDSHTCSEIPPHNNVSPVAIGLNKLMYSQSTPMSQEYIVLDLNLLRTSLCMQYPGNISIIFMTILKHSLQIYHHKTCFLFILAGVRLDASRLPQKIEVEYLMVTDICVECNRVNKDESYIN